MSEGFERLKKEHLLRESVEAVVLEPQFQPLFTPTELERARQRLADHGYTPDELGPRIAEPTAELASLLERVEAAPDQMSRWELRNEVVSHGLAAREAMRAWLASDKFVPFALSVLERLSTDDPTARRIIDAYVAGGGRERKLAHAALDRIRGLARRTR